MSYLQDITIHLQKDEDVARVRKEIQVEMKKSHQAKLERVRESARRQGYNEGRRASSHFQGIHPPVLAALSGGSQFFSFSKGMHHYFLLHLHDLFFWH